MATTTLEQFYESEGLPDMVLKTFSFKFNHYEGMDEETRQCHCDQLSLFISVYCDGIYMTSGIHEKGKNELPHTHVNIVAKNWNPSKSTKNFSRFRAEHWNEYDSLPFPNGVITTKQGQIDNIDNFIDCLAYPLKEGLKCDKSFNIPNNIFLQLKEIGKSKYEAKLQKDRSKERVAERQNNLCDLINLKTLDKEFDNYISFRNYACEQVQGNPENISAIPDQVKLEKAIQSVALFRKIVPCWYFMKSK